MKVTSLQIARHHIAVIEDEPSHWSRDGMGRSALGDGIIRIKASMPEDIKLSTALHEVLHLIADMNGVKISESGITALENGLFEFLRGNPEFVKELCGIDR